MKLNIKYTFVIILLTAFLQQLSSEISESQKKMLEQLPPDQRASVMSKMQAADSIEEELEEVFDDESYMSEKTEWKQLGKLQQGVQSVCDSCIFGYDYFKYTPTTFAPINSASVSSDYILGPGDTLQIIVSFEHLLIQEDFQLV